jgi:hypothetical protein
MTKDAPFKQRVRARMAKTGESYTTARAQLDQSDQPEPAPVITTTVTAEGTEISIRLEDNVLNVTNGDAVVEVLQTPGVQVLPWRDVLHDGPVPATSPEELREIRARYLSRDSHNFQEILRSFEERDRTLESFADRSYVLWFEADLYDQLQLIQILDRLRTLEVDPERIHLVSVGEFPGIARFGGLGQLDHGALMRLLRDAAPVSHEDLDLASSAWAAFTSTDPGQLEAISNFSTPTPALRFLGEAFARLQQEYPWRSDGLSLTQRRIVFAIVDGHRTAGAAFQEVSRRERRPYLGDWSAYALMRDLAEADPPVLTIEGTAAPSDPAFREQPVAVTDYGHEFGSSNVVYEGPDRWIGGVHLGIGERWIYSERAEAISQR